MAAVVVENPYCFSENGKLFALCGADGKLKVWESATGVLRQEYTKNLHLSAPCSALTWIQTGQGTVPKTPRKRKLTAEVGTVQDVIAIGTTTGSIMLYSVDSNNIIAESAAGHTDRVTHLSACKSFLYSCSDDRNIVQWDVPTREVKSKWKSGREQVKCILALSCGEKLLTGSSSIKLWSIEKREVLVSYTGHASHVFHMRELKGRGMFVSAARGDRVVSCWSTSTSDANVNAVSSYLLQENAAFLDVSQSDNLICAITESGVLHIFEQKGKGPVKISKPSQPKITVTIASEGEGVKSPSVSLPIHAALPSPDGASILVAYGSSAFLHFETLVLADYKDEHVVLMRSVKKRVTADEFNSRTRVPQIDEDAEYTKGGTGVTSLRKQRDLPLEQRLENLALVPGEGPLRKDNMAHLLVQGLQSRDRELIQDVLFRFDESVINSTVSNLPIQALVPLLRELTALLQGKTFTNRVAVKWLCAVVKIHAAIILASPDLRQLMAPLAAAIEAKMEGLSGLLKLYGRLNLVAQQMTSETSNDDLGEPLVSYQEREETDSEESIRESDDSDEPEDWDEFSDMDMDGDDLG